MARHFVDDDVNGFVIQYDCGRWKGYFTYVAYIFAPLVDNPRSIVHSIGGEYDPIIGKSVEDAYDDWIIIDEIEGYELDDLRDSAKAYCEWLVSK